MIDIDFSGQPPARPLGWALAVAGGLALCWQAWGLWQVRAQAPDRPHAAPRIAVASSASAPGGTVPRAARLSVEQIVADLSAPWEDLLRAFEARAGQQVAVLRLEPDARSGLVRLTGEARTLASVLAYVRALEGDARLNQVLLTHHQLRASAEPSATEPAASMPRSPGVAPMIEFTLTAAWRPMERSDRPDRSSGRSGGTR